MPKAAGSRPIKKIPYIIATGFTTAFLGDERSLREFIVGDAIKSALERKGKNTLLYLINDSYDPLNYRQLRVGVNKDENLLSRFEPYCGRPISEVPDPFGCHENYSQHFARALIKRLHSLDIYPVLLDSYHTYRKGYYADFISTTFENYAKIQELLSQRFKNFTMKNLFRVQCPKCSCLDATHILKVSGHELRFGCERCGRSDMVQGIDEVRGKLSWKLDCAARWNLYGIDLETFSKAHIAELGSFEISRFISQEFYGGKVPTVARYGDVRLSRELSCKLLKILPPEIFKALFSTSRIRDLILTKDYVEHFCRGYIVRPGMSYIDYVRSELPKRAIHEKSLHEPDLEPLIPFDAQEEHISEKALVTYGNHFSKFYYGREYEIRLPDADLIGSADQATAKMALEVIRYALFVRKSRGTNGHEDTHDLIRSYLHSEKPSPQLFRYLRRILGQADGPNIVTLLAILPRDYLKVIQTMLGYYAGQSHAVKVQKGENDPEESFSALYES
ncbi:MAG: hypothetical protein AB1847_00075 [bacterium]